MKKKTVDKIFYIVNNAVFIVYILYSHNQLMGNTKSITPKMLLEWSFNTLIGALVATLLTWVILLGIIVLVKNKNAFFKAITLKMSMRNYQVTPKVIEINQKRKIKLEIVVFRDR